MSLLRAALCLSIYLAAGCGSGDANITLAISGDCTDADLTAITSLSIDVYGGSDGTTELCSLGKRCVFNVQAQSISDITRALGNLNQPLIDVEKEGAGWIAISGHTSSCFGSDDRVLCGIADLADTQNGVLAMELSCTQCQPEDPDFCP